jgi:ATP-dependent RNA helicase DDX55/SPB4
MAAKLFSELRLSEPTLSVLDGLGFEVMTPVQAAVIPYFLANNDVCVESITGSGKTLAYVVPMVERLLRRSWPVNEVGAVVIAPTRELARQIGTVVGRFCEKTSLKLSLLVGGTDVAEDVRRCSVDGCNVVIGTPGRLLDVITRHGGSIVLKHLDVLGKSSFDRKVIYVRTRAETRARRLGRCAEEVSDSR